MSPEHGPRRAESSIMEPARSQIFKLTADELHSVDRAIVAITVNPDLGKQHGQLRDYHDEIEDVRIIYFVTALRTIVVITYVEA